ncbi:hypothetical protein llap_2943 [Limosa lapponica baueri]|uniref:Rna-directed dna polymerase from mobile element jockey-like n=1 Tax=Limosa lapponica baueri TaxID=1758121 RepID=A0A2I0UL14_LIMLA|nr:hypothetical protein llap_2943 [Limosa lapponica baueri]
MYGGLLKWLGNNNIPSYLPSTQRTGEGQIQTVIGEKKQRSAWLYFEGKRKYPVWSCKVWGPNLNTVFEMQPHQCKVQGDIHFLSPAGHTIPDASQDIIGLLGHLGTLLAQIQQAVDQHPQVLSCQTALQPLFPKLIVLHGVVVTQVQGPTLGLIEPHAIGLDPSIQPVQIPLQRHPTLKKINAPGQLDVICKLTEDALDPLIQVVDKGINQNWPQYRALGNTTRDRPPTGFNSIHHNPLGMAIQPLFKAAEGTPIQAMSPEFLQENAVGKLCQRLY